MSEQELKSLPEAPMSGNIRGYYKGYSIQITARDSEVKVKPLLDKLIEMADYMDSVGFKPSWNEQTNKELQGTKSTAWMNEGSTRLNEPVRVPVQQPSLAIDECPVHNVKMFPKKGKYGTFYSHLDTENGWCNGKGYKS